MEIVRKLAGYSMGRSDLVRRAMSKKKHKVMEEERKNFIYGIVDENGNVEVPGCIRNGIPKESANKIFDQMMDFASYAFNKSHKMEVWPCVVICMENSLNCWKFLKLLKLQHILQKKV